MDEAGDDVGSGEIRHALDDLVHQAHCRFVAADRVLRRFRSREGVEAVVDQLRHLVGVFIRTQPLEGADANVAMAQPRQNRGTSGRRLVAPHQLLASLE